MSQPKDFGPHEIDPLNVELTKKEQIFEVFHAAERVENDWLLGVEYELFGQINYGLTPIPYEGKTSISTFYKFLAERSRHDSDPFEPIYEGENIVALTCKRAVIALEPGGQIEVALKPYHSLKDATAEFSNLLKIMKTHAQTLDIDLFAVGIHPFAARDDMATVKKSRYAIMRSYMGSLQGLGLDMMTRSCAIQINLDYQNEVDMRSKMRLAACLVPFYSLLCASAAFLNQKPVPHAVERGHVWRKTDPDRTGIPAIIFEDNFGYESWIDMVLSVPMYFIRRDSTYHPAHGASFKTFMHDGILGFKATLRDFVDHMTTVFTEVRLKPILEIRSPDSLPVPYVNALTALTWALLYHPAARDQAQERFSHVRHQDIMTLHYEVIDKGRAAQFNGRPIMETAKNLLEIAEVAIDRTYPELKTTNLLQPFTNLVDKNITCAEWIKNKFEPLTQTNLPLLVKMFDPLNNPLL